MGHRPPGDVSEAWQGQRDAEAECERLRGLLALARDGLFIAVEGFSERHHRVYCDSVTDALRRSDPDATSAPETTDGESD